MELGLHSVRSMPKRTRNLTALVPLLLAFVNSRGAEAAAPPCRPCAGVHVTDPLTAAASLREAPPIPQDGRVYVSWDVDLAAADTAATEGAATAVAGAGATPWLRFHFHAPAPVAEHLDALEAELKTTAAVTRAANAATHFQVLWDPPADGTAPTAADYAFLFKRAGVAISGAQTEARVITRAFDPKDLPGLEEFYGQEVAAYLDGVALGVGNEADVTAAIARLTELDPGRPVVVEGIAFPGEPLEALSWAGDIARLGGAIAMLELPQPTAATLRPFSLLASEFRGDLSFDLYSIPSGVAAAWPFVRGSDLGLRIIARAPAGAKELVLTWNDPNLRRPSRLDAATGKAEPITGFRQTSSGVEVRVPNPAPVTVLRLERATAAELKGVAEKIEVASEREIPVEEILRRLQAFDDAQQRKLQHYRATNTTHLRFQATAGAAGTFEATLEGAFFFRQGQGYDWAWQSLYFNGVRWRGKTLPEIPLIQPEKAAAMPLNIELTKRYDYRLRGSDRIADRDCWVVEFRPTAEAQAEQEKLFRGAVWVDKQVFARVQTRAVQLGLEGEVLSNEETVSFRPVDAAGQPLPWGPDAFLLPVRTVSQQLWSVLNTPTVVEREIDLSGIAVNGADFEAQRQAVLSSDATMVRDTPGGMRYLVKTDEGADREVKEGFDKSKLFALGGVFYDDSLDYPLPLVGVNYFSFDFQGKGSQLNAFFGGVLGTVDYAIPRFRGSKWDVGGDAFVFAFPRTDDLFRDNVEAKNEQVKSTTGNVSLIAGHPIGSFFKYELEYEVAYDKYSQGDDTDPRFVLPNDTFTHAFKLHARYARSGYQLGLDASLNRRQDWQPWGLPGNTDFDPDQEQFAYWLVRGSKNWYLPKFQRVSAELDYFGGNNLDRFSKYSFGFFGGNRVHGYQSGRVRAEDGWAAHLSYGFRVGELFRIEAVVDGALANDKASGLDNELLSGVGLVGQFTGPWETLIQLDVGIPTSGPDDGFVAYIVFLKLFH